MLPEALLVEECDYTWIWEDLTQSQGSREANGGGEASSLPKVLSKVHFTLMAPVMTSKDISRLCSAPTVAW